MSVTYRYLIILLFLILTACSSKVNQENFAKIQNGMTLRQVTQILGVPASVDSINIAGISGTSAVWKNNDTVISIQFLNDKAQIKTFTNPNSKLTNPSKNNNS